ncbi:MAG: type II toxin-antitoxin system HicA family toxin [Armatimonadetes bacterium]|nr:type II toxin-antitoxin system HicA family toxin [Armatimonadota bacterium]
MAERIGEMRRAPGRVRFDEFTVVVRALGWVEVRSRGSHYRYRSADGHAAMTVVRPHGDRDYCSVRAVRELLRWVDDTGALDD